MQIIIHRGTNEIGGSCVELSTSKTRILLDLGRPLSGEDYSLPRNPQSIDAVIVSHPHQDHFGLIKHLPSKTPVFIGEIGLKLIRATRLFLKKDAFQNEFKTIHPWESFFIGDLKVTPFLVDHSAIDSFAFLIEGDGYRVFYSGDLRAHGRKKILFEKLLLKPPDHIDLLLLEGTMIARNNGIFSDEASVESAMLEILKNESGPCFLISSSQNLDRIVSAYRASKRAGRIFVIDIYTAWILREISQFFETTPSIQWDDVKVLSKGFTAANHYRVLKSQPEYFGDFTRQIYRKTNCIDNDELASNPRRYFIKTNLAGELINALDFDRVGVIYSMWDGYMKEEFNPTGYKKFQALSENSAVNFHYAHTSGHADLQSLKALAKSLNPKFVVPIHTELKQLYSKHFQRALILDDKQPVNL